MFTYARAMIGLGFKLTHYLNSWNVHQQENRKLTNAVFEVEELLSGFADYRLSRDELRRSFDDVAGKYSVRELLHAAFAARA